LSSGIPTISSGLRRHVFKNPWGEMIMVNRKMNKITDGVKVSFYIPREWHEQMKDLAEKNHIAISDVYRLAIKEFVDRRFVMKVSS
jgi:hypothetical protein